MLSGRVRLCFFLCLCLFVVHAFVFVFCIWFGYCAPLSVRVCLSYLVVGGVVSEIVFSCVFLLLFVFVYVFVCGFAFVRVLGCVFAVVRLFFCVRVCVCSRVGPLCCVRFVRHCSCLL